MAMISDFLIKIQVQGQAAVDKFKTSVDNVDKSVNKLNGSGSVGKLQGALKGLGDTFSSVASTGNNFADGMIGSLGRMGGAASLAFAAVGAAVIGLGMKAITVADQLQDLADATGFTASEVLSFKQSVIAAGGDVDGFEKILAKLNQSTQEAAAGNQKMQQAFKDLGVYVTDSNGEVRESGDILGDIIKRYQDGEITAKEYAASIDLMGKSINRLDLEKLNAVNDPFKNEEIAQLAAYQSAIDSLVASVENKLIAAFGRLAIYINNARKQAASLDQEAASRGKVRTDIFGVSELTGSTPASNRFYTYERDMTPAEKAAYKKQQAAMNAPPVPSIPKGNLGPTGGGFGAAGPKKGGGGGGKSDAQREAEQRKEALDSARQTTVELINQNKEANQLRQIGIDVIGLDSDRANLIRSNAQVQSKAAQEIRALETKIAEEREKGKKANTGVIEELQKQVTEKQAQVDKTKELNQLEYERTVQLGLQKNALEYQKQLIDLMTESERDRLVAAEREKLIKGEIGERELGDKTKIIEAETRHKGTMGRLETELADAKKRQDTVQIDSINTQMSVEQKRHEQAMKNIGAEINFEKQKQGSAAAGAKAVRDSLEEQFSEYNVAQMQSMALWNRMSDAIDTFVDTGKFKFSEFARSIIADLAKIALKKAAVGIFSIISKSIFGGLAAGGPTMANKPYLVGEQGPELFVPNSAGSIMTNASLNKNTGGGQSIQPVVNNTYITNNISAIDSRSVAQMFVENRKSLLGASLMARKEMPYGT
jgi:lambda family phage tail tape measure protein